MSKIKSLAKQTAVYGFSVIVSRLLNIVVTPIVTNVVAREVYGVFSNLYAYVAIIQVLLAFGLETGYFRFVHKEKDKDAVFTTILTFVLIIAGLFVINVVLFVNNIATALNLQLFIKCIVVLSFVLFFDSLTNIALAKLRTENKGKKFAIINISGVAFYLVLVSVIFLILPKVTYFQRFGKDIFSDINLLHYVMYANLAQAFLKFLLLINVFFQVKFSFHKELLLRILKYSTPLLVVQLFGIFNQQIEKIIQPLLNQPADKAMEMLGIYGANAKLILFMTLFNQMFRYAADPFFFSNMNDKNAKSIYADVLKYFVIVGGVVLVGVISYIDIFRYFIGKEFWVGLHIVPILLTATLLNGIFFNLSYWYKINDLNKYGILIQGTATAIFITLNVLLVPSLGYIGSAWAMLAANFTLVVFCYALGRKFYAVPYHLPKIFLFLSFSIASVFIMNALTVEKTLLKYLINTLFLLGYIGLIFISERKNILSIIHKKTVSRGN